MSVFPFRMQHDAMQCGIACLQMVCEYHGRKMSAAEVEELCPSTAEGVSLLGMSRAAEALGLHTVSGRLPVDMLAKAPLPCILHWRQRHFVVLYRIRGRGRRLRYCVADPAKGLVEYSRAELEEGWLSSRSDGEDKGIAMLLETTPAFAEAATGKRGGDTGSVRFLMAYV
ncbi:MAG TPA: peptidase domain-containing ABC transporter, partial [Candidatus Prevotella intestinigallinarum]|nr:peptidase domain-containing ABC transporter [Candidatus Prevotella intestinigallinarum]